jgi:flagellar biosynthesis protein FlhF
MRLKSFYAKTVTEAMQMIRDTLGEDAIIVATREENGGKNVRVTAAVEHDSFESYDEFERGSADPGERVAGWLQYDEEEEEGSVAEILTEVMLKHSVPEEITDQVISCATVVGLEQPHIALVAALEHLFGFKQLPERAPDKAFMLIGPPGAGKTLAAAKLAARSVMNGQKVNLITTDTVRAGGFEQLSAFAKILNVPLQKARDERELKRALDVFGDGDLTIIDSGGFNPFRSDEMRDLARLMSAGNIDPVLLMPAGMDADECGEMARIYAALGVRQMMPTRIDLARRLGGLLTAAHQGSLIFADASDNAQVADGLFAMSPDRLANLLMPQPPRSVQQRKTSTDDQTPIKRPVNA